MKRIDISHLNENFIEAIGHEWMLVTAGTPGRFNTMTASWGGIGYLWNRPVVFVFVRPERYTFEFTEREPGFTLTFLGSEGKEIHKVCGSHSGRDTDKVAETGLRPLATEAGYVTFEQGRLCLECKKLYTDTLKEEGFVEASMYDRWYGTGPGESLHRVYVAEITGAWIRE